jgi:ATP-dependent DNA ligase
VDVSGAKAPSNPLIGFASFDAAPIFTRMRTSFLPCLPTRGTSVPATPAWFHEIKYYGYRLIVQREGSTVRFLSRNGNDWSGRYPWIDEAALKNKHSHFVIDGEAVVLGVDGIADFNALHSRKHNHEVQLYAFDILALDGEDLRGLPLSLRKAHLVRLLARRPDGIFIAPFEQGRSGLISSARPATWGSRAWCRSFPIALR